MQASLKFRGGKQPGNGVEYGDAAKIGHHPDKQTGGTVRIAFGGSLAAYPHVFSAGVAGAVFAVEPLGFTGQDSSNVLQKNAAVVRVNIGGPDPHRIFNVLAGKTEVAYCGGRPSGTAAFQISQEQVQPLGCIAQKIKYAGFQHIRMFHFPIP